jgi:hypothetical protein
MALCDHCGAMTRICAEFAGLNRSRPGCRPNRRRTKFLAQVIHGLAEVIAVAPLDIVAGQTNAD